MEWSPKMVEGMMFMLPQSRIPAKKRREVWLPVWGWVETGWNTFNFNAEWQGPIPGMSGPPAHRAAAAHVAAAAAAAAGASARRTTAHVAAALISTPSLPCMKHGLSYTIAALITSDCDLIERTQIAAQTRTATR